MQEVKYKGFLTIEVDTDLAKQRAQQLKQEKDETRDQLQHQQLSSRNVKGARTPTASSSVQVAVPLLSPESGEANPQVGVSVGPQARPPKTMWRRFKSAMTAKTGYKRKRGGTKKKRTRRKRKKTRRKKKRRKKKTIKRRRRRGRKTRRK